MWLLIREKEAAIITKKILTCFLTHSFFLSFFRTHNISLRNPSYNPTWHRKSFEDLPRKIYEMEPRILPGNCSLFCFFFVSLHFTRSLHLLLLTADFLVCSVCCYFQCSLSAFYLASQHIVLKKRVLNISVFATSTGFLSDCWVNECPTRFKILLRKCDKKVKNNSTILAAIWKFLL